MHRGGAVAIDMTDRVPEQSSLRPVLGRVEDTPPAARHDHNPAMHIEGTAELAPTQIPLRIPYTEGWSRDWDALRASTRHRMFANNVTTATSVPRQESTEMDVGSGQREGPFQDSIGWIVRYLAEQDSVTPQKKENESTALTLHRVGSAGWDDPWTFHDALGPESNKEAGATLVSGAHIVHTTHERSQSLLLFVQSNPYFPFFLRLVNIGLITATMAVAIRLRIHLQSSSSESEVGDSPLVAIIFSPPSIAHAFFQTWLEYFSRPIGLWLTSSKLMFTALELVFICLWSAELSLLSTTLLPRSGALSRAPPIPTRTTLSLCGTRTAFAICKLCSSALSLFLSLYTSLYLWYVSRHTIDSRYLCSAYYIVFRQNTRTQRNG